MKPSPSRAAALLLAGLFVVAGLLAGCAAPQQEVGVSSPPPPLVGSAPLSAYDDYALAWAPPGQLGAPGLAQIEQR
jgi:hypothetical protein